MNEEKRRQLWHAENRHRVLRLRGYRAPAAMVREATAARLAGDWRAACAAAMVDVDLDPAEVCADLAGFAPDFLRLHLPYVSQLAGQSWVPEQLALRPGAQVVLSRHDGPLQPGTPVLVATLPPHDQAAQRLRLRVADIGDLRGPWYDMPAWTWHADAVAERRWAYGASEQRLPWHFPDGSPYPVTASTPAGAEPGRAADFERMAARYGDRAAQYRQAGFTVADRSSSSASWRLDQYAPALPLLAAETRRLSHRYAAMGLTSLLSPDRDAELSGSTLTVLDGERERRWSGRLPVEAERTGPVAFGVVAPDDVDLLRWDWLQPGDLHPLALEALFPRGEHRWGPPSHDAYERVRVRCEGVWHEVEVTGAALALPSHDPAGLTAATASAGAGAGCARALSGFRSGAPPVPRDLRRARRRLFDRAFHGDTAAVLADLHAGADPQVRDGRGRTLLHWAGHVDHTRVLPLLLTAGFSPHDRAEDGRTPLHTAAAAWAGSPDVPPVLAALIAAGADPEALDARGLTAAQVLHAG